MNLKLTAFEKVCVMVWDGFVAVLGITLVANLVYQVWKMIQILTLN